MLQELRNQLELYKFLVQRSTRQRKADSPFIIGTTVVWKGITVGISLSFMMLKIVAVKSTEKAEINIIFSYFFFL